MQRDRHPDTNLPASDATLRDRLADVFRSIAFLPGEAYGPHSHRRIEINYVTRGSCSLTTASGRLTFRKGETMIISPGTDHRFQAGRKGASLLQLEMLPEVLDNAIGVTSDEFPDLRFRTDEPVMRIAGDARIRSTIHAIIWALANRAPGYRHAAMLNYAQLLLLLGRHASRNAASESWPQPLRTAVAALRRTFSSPVCMAEIAAESGVSDRRLRKLFATHLSTSPAAYLNGLRIARATALLTAGEHSVKEVCFACGFSSPQYFSRAYRKATGHHPGDLLGR